MGVPMPSDEGERLEALRRYHILDSPPDPPLDHLAGLAAELLGAPISAVSLVAEDRTWYKSRRGLEVSQFPREGTFCAYTILSDEVLCVEDARADPRFASSPMVTGPPGIRYYAGAPIKTPDEHRLGALCVLDTVPRPSLAPAQRLLLAGLAGTAISYLEARREALEARRDAGWAANGGIPAGLALLDEHGRFLHVNPEFRQICGYESEELAGRPLLSLLQSANPAGSRFETIVSAAEGAGVFRMVRKDGAVLDVHLALRPAALAGGARGTTLVLNDLTRFQRAADRLQQSRKMEAVGRLAGGIAHRWNNLLTIITGYSDMVQAQAPPGSGLYGYAQEIARAAQRMAALSNHLLAFSRRRFVEPRILDLNRLLLELGQALHRAAGKDLHVAIVPGGDLGEICADPSEIEEVLRHLIVNAREAGSAKVTISTSNLGVEGDDTREPGDVAPGLYVLLAVSDDGPGMDPGASAHLFEPFFTTKGMGRGTGLATVYGIVRQCGGEVAVSSEPGKGTTFRIYLPRVHAEAKANTAKLVKGRAGTEVVLLVGDEPPVRNALARILRRLGYTALDAATPAEALQLGDRYTGPIHLMIAAVSMPGMIGPELAERLSSHRPGMKVLYLAGSSAEPSIEQTLANAGAAFLRKPFSIEALSEHLRDLLDAPTSPD